MPIVERFFPYNSWAEGEWFDLLGVLFLFVFCDRNRWRSWRNLDLVMMCAWIPLGDYEMGHQPTVTALSYLPLLYFWARLVRLIVRPPAASPEPRFSRRALAALSVVFLLYNAALIFTAPFPFAKVGDKYFHISDSSVLGILGADEILSGNPPYGHMEIPGDGAMPYAPAYFLWFVPATAALGIGDPYFDYATAARVTTLALLGLSFWLARRLGKKLGGETWESAFGFAWTVMPYTQSATYWSWTGNLLPGVMALIGLNALMTRRALPVAAAVAGAGGVSWLPFAWIPVWLFGVDRTRWLRYAIVACALSVFLVALGMAQAHGPARLWGDVFSYVVAKDPDWENPWSPFTYHKWAQVIRIGAFLAAVPTGIWTLLRLRRASVVGLWLLAAVTALLIVNGELLKTHAPGRMTLWTLPFFLVVFVLGPTEERLAVE